MSITSKSVIQRRADALAADVGGEVVLMSVERGKYYGLDEIGSDIWRMIEQPTEVSRVCEQLLQRYDGDPAAVEHDVISLLQQLGQNELLEPLE